MIKLNIATRANYVFSFYEYATIKEAEQKMQHLMQRNPNLMYTIEKV